MKPAPKNELSPFDNFAKNMKALLAVSKPELDVEIEKHERKAKTRRLGTSKRRSGSKVKERP